MQPVWLPVHHRQPRGCLSTSGPWRRGVAGYGPDVAALPSPDVLDGVVLEPHRSAFSDAAGAARRADLRHPHPRGPRRAVAAGVRRCSTASTPSSTAATSTSSSCSTSSPTVAPLWSARGNGEDGSAGRPIAPDDDRLRYSWLLDLAGVRVGLTHDVPMPELPPNYTVERWKLRRFGTPDIDVLVYGDSHVERIDVVGPTLCVNPGSPTYPHNLNTQLGTLGFLDIDPGRSPGVDLAAHRRRHRAARPPSWTRAATTDEPTDDATRTCSSRPTGRSPRSR